MIGIIDYGMGNLRSVQKAFGLLGATAVILRSPGELDHVERVVLPGVGAFADGMQHLTQRGWVQPFLRHIESGKPTLGICLGMQLLFESSEEDAVSPDRPVVGLGVLPGRVVRFCGDQYGPGLKKVPHMGWNTIAWTRDDPLFAGLLDGPAVYFVHSYYAKPVEPATAAPIASSFADYGGSFCASVWRENIWATQFHPEKSQRVGLHMLRNFVAT